jgi:hypothetical protein
LKKILLVEPISSGSQFKEHIDYDKYELYALFVIDYKNPNLTEQVKHLQGEVDEELSDSRYKEFIFLKDFESYGNFISEMKHYDFDAVIPGSEYGVSYAEKIAESLGTPNNDMKKGGYRRDKILMQEALREKDE